MIYLQSGVIPYKKESDELQVLLITSRSNKRWIIPKGLIEPDLTPEESAVEEAYEEAGIKGKIMPDMLGEYKYHKWGGTCVVKVFPMEVTEILDHWPEASFRKREWVPVTVALSRLKETDLKKMMQSLPKFLNKTSD